MIVSLPDCRQANKVAHSTTLLERHGGSILRLDGINRVEVQPPEGEEKASEET